MVVLSVVPRRDQGMDFGWLVPLESGALETPAGYVHVHSSDLVDPETGEDSTRARAGVLDVLGSRARRLRVGQLVMYRWRPPSDSVAFDDSIVAIATAVRADGTAAPRAAKAWPFAHR
jgi:hypothetical protein